MVFACIFLPIKIYYAATMFLTAFAVAKLLTVRNDFKKPVEEWKRWIVCQMIHNGGKIFLGLVFGIWKIKVKGKRDVFESFLIVGFAVIFVQRKKASLLFAITLLTWTSSCFAFYFSPPLSPKKE